MSLADQMSYLRISLLNACNLGCVYCRPANCQVYSTENRLTVENYQNAIELLYEMGVRKVRFTGGEPTLFKGLTELIKYTKKLDNNIFTALTSNGILLEQVAVKLADAGLDNVNISIDTLERDKFKRITTIDGLSKVVAGIKAAIKHIPQVKLNSVLIKGINDNEVQTLIKFANDLNISIRFIEFMPSQSSWHDGDGYISGDEIRQRLPYILTPVKSDLSAAARYYSSPELNIKVGFISPVSHPFCANCNRLRLASDGKLYSCLFSDQKINLVEILEDDSINASDRIKKLVESKEYLGCAQALQTSEKLPSFLNMGG